MDQHQHGTCYSYRRTLHVRSQRPIPHAIPTPQKAHEATRYVRIAILGLVMFPVLAFGQEPTIAEMLRTNTEYRATLRRQIYSASLTRAAKSHADYMAKTSDFAHRGDNGTPGTRAAKAGYDGEVSENIGRGYASVEDVFKAWRNSKSHWESIQADYKEVGFGFAVARDGTTFWVVLYGNPSSTPAYLTPSELGGAKQNKKK